MLPTAAGSLTHILLVLLGFHRGTSKPLCPHIPGLRSDEEEGAHTTPCNTLEMAGVGNTHFPRGRESKPLQCGSLPLHNALP